MDCCGDSGICVGHKGEWKNGKRALETRVTQKK